MVTKYLNIWVYVDHSSSNHHTRGLLTDEWMRKLSHLIYLSIYLYISMYTHNKILLSNKGKWNLQENDSVRICIKQGNQDSDAYCIFSLIFRYRLTVFLCIYRSKTKWVCVQDMKLGRGKEKKWERREDKIAHVTKQGDWGHRQHLKRRGLGQEK